MLAHVHASMQNSCRINQMYANKLYGLFTDIHKSQSLLLMLSCMLKYMNIMIEKMTLPELVWCHMIKCMAKEI